MSKPHDVASPLAIPLKDWRAIAVRVFHRIGADRIGVLAGGVAFYAFLSVFPAMAGALMIWGLFTDMKALGAQLQTVRDFAPDAFGLIADQMIRIATQDRHGLTLGA